MEKSESKVMAEKEKEELQDRYIRFDWAIKRLLRQKANFDVLEGFLSVVLKEEVKIIELLESESNQETAEDKYNRVDIKALNSKGEIVIIEVQNTRERDAVVPRLPSEIFPEYILIRVNEFDKVACTPLDEWIKYLKDGTIRPDTTAPGLREAREKLKYYSMSVKERRAYDEHLNVIMIQNDVLSTAKWEGRIEGLAEGEAKGMEKGIAKGLLQAAMKMKLAGMPLPVIADCTGLTVEEIEMIEKI